MYAQVLEMVSLFMPAMAFTTNHMAAGITMSIQGARRGYWRWVPVEGGLIFNTASVCDTSGSSLEQ